MRTIHDPEMLPVLQDLCGEWRSSIVASFAFLDLGDLLDDIPKSIDELSKSTAADPESLYRLLRCASAMGYAKEVPAASPDNPSGRRFTGTPRSRILKSDTLGSLHATALMTHSGIQATVWHSLSTAVQTGGTVLPPGETFYSLLESRPHDAKIFNRAMAALSWNTEVAEGYDFAQATTVVDIGGGLGRLLAEVLHRHPGLRGMLIEQAQATRESREFFTEEQIIDRCDITEGNLFTEIPRIPEDSIVMLKFVLHNWPDADALKILGTVRQALPASSRLLIAEPILPEYGSEAYPAMLDLLMLLILGGKERTAREHRNLLEQSGFRFERHIPLLPQVSLIEATGTDQPGHLLS